MFQKLRDMYHDVMWRAQYKSCLCVYDPKDEALYHEYLSKVDTYTKNAYFEPTFRYPTELAKFEKKIHAWLKSIPSPGHPNWENMWLKRLMECDTMIRNSKNREEAQRYQSIKDIYTYRKTQMEENYQEHLELIARRCHCPKHRYMKNSG